VVFDTLALLSVDLWGSIMRIKDKTIGSGRCFIMAEIASAHCGSVETLKIIFRNSVEAGADAVKVQVFNADALCSVHNPDHATLKKIELSRAEWEEVFAFARTFDTILFAEVFDEESADFAAPYVDGLSLHASDITYPFMVSLVAGKGKPLILNVGGSTLSEINAAVKAASTVNKDLIIMYGIQNFPTAVSDVNLNRLRTLMKLGYPVGYHDHTEASHHLALPLSLAACALGAAVVEKHVTDDRGKKGYDYISSLHKDEFAALVAMVRDYEKSLGGSEITLSAADEVYRKRIKKFIVASHDLAAGTVIQLEDIAFKRTQGGILSDQYSQVVGKKLKRDVRKDEKIEMGELG
jgi:sialic acid synthase SpsE